MELVHGYFSEKNICPIDLRQAFAKFYKIDEEKKIANRIKIVAGTVVLTTGVAYACYKTGLYAWAIDMIKQWRTNN